MAFIHHNSAYIEYVPCSCYSTLDLLVIPRPLLIIPQTLARPLLSKIENQDFIYLQVVMAYGGGSAFEVQVTSMVGGPNVAPH